MQPRDPRAVLGLPPDATREEAQRAFRRLAKRTHPDAGGDAGAFGVVAVAWAALGPLLPPPAPPVPPRATVPPHVRATCLRQGRVVWAESRRPPRRDFAALLEAEMARRAA